MVHAGPAMRRNAVLTTTRTCRILFVVRRLTEKQKMTWPFLNCRSGAPSWSADQIGSRSPVQFGPKQG